LSTTARRIKEAKPEAISVGRDDSEVNRPNGLEISARTPIATEDVRECKGVRERNVVGGALR
jgi:hypothetical protein